MRRAVLGLVLLMAASAHAAEPRVPFAPFAEAEVGDWCVLAGTSSWNNRRVRVVWRVVAASASEVKVRVDRFPSRRYLARRVLALPRHRIPSFESFLEVKPDRDRNPYDVGKVASETVTLDGRAFAASVLRVNVHGDNYRGDTRHVFSPVVRASGLVQQEIAFEKGLVPVSVAGFGRADTVEWGRRPEEISVDTWAPEDDSERGEGLPFHPFVFAEEGDWNSVLATVTPIASAAAPLLPKQVVTWRVRHVAANGVSLELAQRPGPPGEDRWLWFSRERVPGVGDYLRVLGDSVVGPVTRAEDVVERLGRRFPCRRIEATTRNRDGLESRVKLWLSPEVRGTALVRLELETRNGPIPARLEMVLVGFGNKEGPLLGQAPEDVPLESGK